MELNLKYPILFVHGMGYRDYKHICYWGRIPKTLKKMGCTVFFGQQDSNASIETNANHLVKRINQILEETGAEKVNIIAHSKGGLDTRYAITTLSMKDKIASLTTISTPHNGSKTVDFFIKFPAPLFCASVVFLWICGFVLSATKSLKPTRLSNPLQQILQKNSMRKTLIAQRFITKAIPLL